MARPKSVTTTKSRQGRYTYEWPRPAVTVDLVLFVLGDDGLEVPLIRRAQEPFRDRWALPGGFVDETEDLADAARREMREETGIRVKDIVQVGAYGEPGRDPRGHSVGVGFVGCGRRLSVARGLKAGDDAAEARLYPLVDVPPLAFDHDHILHDAWRVLQREAVARVLVFDIIPRRFTQDDLARALTAIGPRTVTARQAATIIDKTAGTSNTADEQTFSRAAWARAQEDPV